MKLNTLKANIMWPFERLIFLFAILALFSCQNSMDKDSPVGSALPFYIGTYTGSGSRGIYKGLLDNEGHIELKGLAAETENPSFLAFSTNGEFLLAVNEIGPEGKLESFRIEGDSLILVSRSSSGGAHPCFVSLNNDGYILTANYSSGTVGLLKMNNKGELNGLLDAQQHRGSGTTNRQKGPHAHSAMFEPASTGVISVDLGTNELWFSELDTIGEKLLPAKQGRLAMDPGAGPRHLAFHPTGKWLYVINELNSTVTLVKKNETGIFERGPSYSTLPASYEGDNYCADIHISSDGNYVYASNRGHNSIAIFKVENKTGSLIPSGHSPTCGEWPRNFALSPGEDYLLVANQHSNNIVSLRRDRLSGSVEAVDTIKVTSPVCILFR